MDVVGAPQSVPAPERVEDARAFDHGRRNGQTDEGKPCDRGQDVQEDEGGKRQEDDHADDEGPRKAAPLDGPPGDDRRGPHVRGGHERDSHSEADDRLGAPVQRGQERPEDADRHAERERRPEPARVEAERLGHDLPDSARLRRQRRRQGLLRLPRHGVTVTLEYLGRGRLGGRSFVEAELAVLRVHANGVALGELALEQPQRERVLEQALDRALQRPGAVGRVPAGLG